MHRGKGEQLHRLNFQGGMLHTGLYFPDFGIGEYPPTGNSVDMSGLPWPRKTCTHDHVSKGVCMNPKCNRKIDPFTGKVE